MDSPAPAAGAGQRGNRRLGHLVQPLADRPLVETLAMDAGVVLRGRPDAGVAAARHPLHVPTGAERAAGARQHDASDVGVHFDLDQNPRQRLVHRRRHGVATFGSVHRERGDAFVDFSEQVVGTRVDRSHRRQSTRWPGYELIGVRLGGCDR